MVSSLGGWNSFTTGLENLPEKSLTVPGNTGFWKLPMLFTICLFMPLGGIIQPAQWMRFYSARNTATLRHSALVFVIILTGCFLVGIMLVGLGGQILYPLQQTDAGGIAPHSGVSSYDQILVVIIKEKLPLLLGPTIGYFFASVMIVAIMAAAMSTADSNLHAMGALITRDIYDQFVRPQANEAERVWVGRAVILLTTFFSLLFVLKGAEKGSSLAGFMEMIVNLALFAVAFAVQLLPITLDMLYIRRGTAAGAIAGLFIGLVIAFSFTTLPGVVAAAIYGDVSQLAASDQPWLVQWIGWVGQAKKALPIHATAWGLIPNAVVFLVISAVTKPVSHQRRSEFADAIERG